VGVPLANATNASLAVGPVSLQDEGKRYGVSATNAQGSVTSPWATLSVTERAWVSAAMPPTGASGSGATATQEGTPAAKVDSRGHTHALFNQFESKGAVTMWAAFKPATARRDLSTSGRRRAMARRHRPEGHRNGAAVRRASRHLARAA